MKSCSATTHKGTQCSRRACAGNVCAQHRKMRDEISLIEIKPSTDRKHKYVAIFEVNGKQKITRFGAKGYNDFILFNQKFGRQEADHHKKLYVQRHTKDLRTRDITSPGSASMFVLWNYPTLKSSIQDYKRRIKEKDFSLPKTI